MSGTVAVPLAPPPRARLRSAVRLAVCAAVPWFLCLWWGTSTVPVPAALPAVLILRDDVYDAPRRGWERLVGVVVGVALTTLVLHWLPPPTASSVASLSVVASASFLAVLACGCAGMYLMYQGGAPNQQVLVSALVIYATALPGYAVARLAESAVGIATVVLLGPLLWPPDPGAGRSAHPAPPAVPAHARPTAGRAGGAAEARRPNRPHPPGTSPRNSRSAPGPTAPTDPPGRPYPTRPCATSPRWYGPPPARWTPPCAARTAPRTSTGPASWTSPTARPTPPGTTRSCGRVCT
ncbi:FUSC family protein [Streptomyces virginiae]|uniref:FUSC family protein n=1 Tax=Streptomyces virginiae TaxID=1961 RepID=UPI0036A19197